MLRVNIILYFGIKLFDQHFRWRGDRIFSATKTVKTGIRLKTSFPTNFSTGSTTLVSTSQFQTSMTGWASGTTTLKTAVTYGRILTPCQLAGSISLRGRRVSSTATPRATRQMESTTTSIPEANWSVTILFCMDFWRKYFPVKTNFLNDVTQGRVTVLPSLGAFHLLKISGISGSAVNGTRFVGSSHWKIPRKSGKSKKVVPFSRSEFRNGISCSIYVSRSLYQFQVHGRAPPRTGVYDQMEQLLTNRKFHFCYHRNFRVFFLNGKRP